MAKLNFLKEQCVYYIFLYLVVIHMLFWKSLFKYFAYSFKTCFLSPSYKIVNFLYIINKLIIKYIFYKYFLPESSILFLFSNSSFGRAEYLNFDEVNFTLLRAVFYIFLRMFDFVLA